MRFFLKNRGLQAARIVLLLVAGAALITWTWLASEVEILSIIPLWIVIAFTIVATVYRMRHWKRGGDA